jgi:YHS domain-containing protein
MTRRVVLALAGLVAVAAVACRSRGSPGTASALRPQDPVDESFRGCQESKSCGSHSPAEGAALVLQPEAKLGDYTRCPVSGAVFQISGTRQHRDYKGHTLCFCCLACAQYFDEHADAVAAARLL